MNMKIKIAPPNSRLGCPRIRSARLTGSSSKAPIPWAQSSSRSWLKHFKAQHPDTTFDIAAEGSTTGIAAIIDGTAQIGMSSRRAKPAEVGTASGKGVNMKPTIVAYDGIAVIVNSGNRSKV